MQVKFYFFSFLIMFFVLNEGKEKSRCLPVLFSDVMENVGKMFLHSM